VVEAGSRGGALITADIANSYNRDVFAVPGRLSDTLSEGSNFLVKTNRAALIQGASDVEYMMGWRESYKPAEGTQRRILLDLSPEAECIVKILQERGQSGIDDLCTDSELSMSKVSTLLLNLEFEGVVKCLPGKLYTLS
jgi:DNA processing protein